MSVCRNTAGKKRGVSRGLTSLRRQNTANSKAANERHVVSKLQNATNRLSFKVHKGGDGRQVNIEPKSDLPITSKKRTRRSRGEEPEASAPYHTGQIRVKKIRGG